MPDNFENSQATNEKQLGPREYIASIETIAQQKIQYMADLYKLYVDSEKISIDANNVRIKPGNIDVDLSEAQWDLYRERVDQVQSDNEIVLGAVNSLSSAIIAKRILSNNSERAIRNIEGDETFTEMQHNHNVARYMFITLYPGIEPPESLQYAETPVGILFTAKTAEELAVLDRDIYNYRHNTNIQATPGIGGFADVPYYAHATNVDPQRPVVYYSVGVMFLPNTSESPEDLAVQTVLYKHEEQHVLDLVVFPDLDKQRITRLHFREHQAEKSLLEQTLTDVSLASIKTEIFAYNTTNYMDTGYDSPYLTLTRSKVYNYQNVLDTAEEKETKNENKILQTFRGMLDVLRSSGNLNEKTLLSLADQYKKFIRDSTVAFQEIQNYYYFEFKNSEYASQMAISVLSAFPLEDWPSVSKGVARFSQFDTYRVEHEKWLQELEVKREQWKADLAAQYSLDGIVSDLLSRYKQE